MSFANLITGCHHIGVPTNDIKASVDFYKMLGFKVTMETIMPGTDTPFVFLDLGNITIETYQNNAGVGTAGAVDHIALQTDDIDATFAAAKAAGLQLERDCIDAAQLWNGVRCFFIKGPNGERIEFFQLL